MPLTRALTFCTCIVKCGCLPLGIFQSSIHYAMKGYHAEPFLKHSGKKNNNHPCYLIGRARISLCGCGEDIWATMIQLPVTTKPLKVIGMPPCSFFFWFLSCPRITDLKDPPYSVVQKPILCIFFLPERSQESRLRPVSNYIVLQVCKKAGSAIIIIIVIIIILILFYFIRHFPARTAFIHYCKVQTVTLVFLWMACKTTTSLFAEYEELSCQATATVSVSVAHSACVYFINLTSAR